MSSLRQVTSSYVLLESMYLSLLPEESLKWKRLRG